MDITVAGQHHDAPLIFRGVNESGQSLVIQTGSLTLNLDETFEVAHLSYPVINLASLGIAHVSDLIVHASATCTPAAFQLGAGSALPMGLKAVVQVRASGNVNEGGFVSVSGTGSGPVVGDDGQPYMVTGYQQGAIYVESVEATHSGDNINLEANIIVAGNNKLARVGYSVFVSLSKPLKPKFARTATPLDISP